MSIDHRVRSSRLYVVCFRWRFYSQLSTVGRLWWWISCWVCQSIGNCLSFRAGLTLHAAKPLLSQSTSSSISSGMILSKFRYLELTLKGGEHFDDTQCIMDKFSLSNEWESSMVYAPILYYVFYCASELRQSVDISERTIISPCWGEAMSRFIAGKGVLFCKKSQREMKQSRMFEHHLWRRTGEQRQPRIKPEPSYKVRQYHALPN